MGTSGRRDRLFMIREILYRAAWVLPATAPPLRDGYVAVRDGVITSVGVWAERPRDHSNEVDLGATILMPGFVNAHTHLELSHLGGGVSGGHGFVPWVEDLLRVRAERPAEEIPVAIGKAIKDLRAGGTAAVADVSNSLAAAGPLGESTIHALLLHEVLGFDPAKAGPVMDQTRAMRAAVHPGPRVRIAVAAHAPHSMAKELMAALMKDGGIRSIHVAESKAEDDFLMGGGGEWRDFLDRRVGSVAFEAPGLRPVPYLDSLGVLAPGLLGVHCVRVDESDAALLAARGVVAVLCPRSNEFLGNGVPPLALLLGRGVSLALGTDSLASCASLDVLEDARVLARKFPRVPKAAIFHALTRGGALALGFEQLGEIREGCVAEFAALPFEGPPPADPLSFVLNETGPARGLVP